MNLVISQGTEDVKINGDCGIRLRHHLHREQLSVKVFASLSRFIQIISTGASVNDPRNDHAKVISNLNRKCAIWIDPSRSQQGDAVSLVNLDTQVITRHNRTAHYGPGNLVDYAGIGATIAIATSAAAGRQSNPTQAQSPQPNVHGGEEVAI
ncbi:hypothetical protein [Aeromonas media]|uniref:hypothetical protein n=1 Tax=Aeromonas media TaxID=651 RepID=UPI00143DAF85|nr:hypothetical protein [Aeromonas media]MBS4700813.1 hypothetical protein [Aeromonas media]QIY87351.1 hypothetical protein HFP99_12240 [Aeromonas hydrophila]